MAHSDDDGLVLPPKLAPIQVVIVPIYKGEEQLELLRTQINPIIQELRAKGISVKFDDRDTHKPGWKFAEYELKGVPLRLAMGMRDLENHTIEVFRRDTKEKETLQIADLPNKLQHLLDQIQLNLYQKALAFRDSMIHTADTFDEFQNLLDTKGGFISAHWDGTSETELKIKELTKATIRCIPLQNKLEEGKCIYSGKPSNQRVLFARAY